MDETSPQHPFPSWKREGTKTKAETRFAHKEIPRNISPFISHNQEPRDCINSSLLLVSFVVICFNRPRVLDGHKSTTATFTNISVGFVSVNFVQDTRQQQSLKHLLDKAKSLSAPSLSSFLNLLLCLLQPTPRDFSLCTASFKEHSYIHSISKLVP